MIHQTLWELLKFLRETTCNRITHTPHKATKNVNMSQSTSLRSYKNNGRKRLWQETTTPFFMSSHRNLPRRPLVKAVLRGTIIILIPPFTMLIMTIAMWRT
ncbi:unnamed protein product [Ixodes pacificus]